MVDEFVTFEEYANAVKKALEGITHDNNMGDVDPVMVIYATPPAAFAKFKGEAVNGQRPGPLISFYLSNIDIEPSEQLGGYYSVWIGKEYKYKAPIIAKLSYTVIINAIKESQADLLQAQIMMAMPFNRPYATMINGQWATMEAKDGQNLTTVEMETDGDKVSKRQITVEIARAYFDYPIQVNTKFINSINSHIYSVEKQEVIKDNAKKNNK